MAPQTSIPVAANVLGAIRDTEQTPPSTLCDGRAMGAVEDPEASRFWCVQLIPQIWTNWRTKKTDGLPALMMFLWGVCGVPFGAYAVIQNFNIPIQVQPQVFMGLCLLCWSQILIYGNGWSVKKAAATGLAMAILFAGIETALILTLKPIYERGNDAPALVVGIIASIFLAAGLVPPYFEIYKRRGRVVGINFFFLAMDWSGAFFSLMALVAQNTFDILGGILYIICAILEIGIFLSHIIWLIRTRKLRKRAKAEGKTFDELATEIIAAEGADNFPFAERPLHWFFTSAWWRNRLNGQSMKPDTLDLAAAAARRNDEEQALPIEKAAEAPFEGPSIITAAASTPAIATQATPATTDDVCRSRSCSDSVAPTQCGEVETEFNEKQ